MRKLQIIGMVIVIIALGLLWIMYDWKLMLILLLLLWGNNMEQRGRTTKEIIDKLKNK